MRAGERGPAGSGGTGCPSPFAWLEPRYSRLQAEDVPLPDEVVEAAKQAFASKLEVTH